MLQRPPSNSANLKPKEHGAYAIVSIPLGLALLLTGPTVSGGCIAIAAFTGFLVHEPLLVALGRRGQRAQRSTPEALPRMLTLTTTAVVSGLVALATSQTPVQIALIVCLALAVTGFAIAVGGKHRTLGGQVWGVIGLSAPSVPILLAGGVPIIEALKIWMVLLLGFQSTTLAVRGVIASQKRQPRLVHWGLLSSITAGISVGLAMGEHWVLATIPMITASWYLMLQPPAAKHLKRVGWSIVSATMLTAIATAFLFWTR